jgi:hypothetical protein
MGDMHVPAIAAYSKTANFLNAGNRQVLRCMHAWRMFLIQQHGRDHLHTTAGKDNGLLIDTGTHFAGLSLQLLLENTTHAHESWPASRSQTGQVSLQLPDA